MASVDQAFIEQSRQYLHGEYLPKIERCLERLSEEDVWWRPDEASNSITKMRRDEDLGFYSSSPDARPLWSS